MRRGPSGAHRPSMGSGRLKENTMTSSNAGALVRGKPGGGAGGASLRSQSTGPIRSGFQSAVGAAGGSLLSGAGAERKPGEVVLMSKKYRRGTRAVDPMPESRVIDTKKYGSAMKAQRQNAEDEFMNTLMTSMERGRPKKESKEETRLEIVPRRENLSDLPPIAADKVSMLFTWGNTQMGQSGLAEPECDHFKGPRVMCSALDSFMVRSVATGWDHCLALTQDGDVYSWGAAFNFKLGHGDKDKCMVPKKIAGLSGIDSVAAGDNHNLALAQDGAVFSWGCGRCGALGHGDEENQPTPVPIKKLMPSELSWGASKDRVIVVACGTGHSGCVTAQGSVLTWGRNRDGQLGVGGNMDARFPSRLRDFEGMKDKLRVVDLSLGWSHSAAVTLQGRLYTWGQGSKGALGHGDGASLCAPFCVKALANQYVHRVSAGWNMTLALTMEDRLYMCGSIGNEPAAFVPHCKLTTGLVGKDITALSAGWAHGAAHAAAGCYVWGSAVEMPGTDRLPSALRGANGVLPRNHIISQVACGGSHTVMLLHVGAPMRDQFLKPAAQ